MANNCNPLIIDDLFERLYKIKSEASKLSINLIAINEKVSAGDYVQQDMFLKTTVALERFNKLQDVFYYNMKENFTDFPIGNFEKVEKFLNDSKINNCNYEKAVEILMSFQSISIDHEETKTQLIMCKEMVSNILKSKDIDKVIEAALPFELFLNLMDTDANDITIEQEEIIERAFPKPMPRMLYSKSFYKARELNSEYADVDNQELTGNNNIKGFEEDNQEEQDNRQVVQVNKQEDVENVQEYIQERNQIETNTDNSNGLDETVNQYSYNTQKIGKPFSVSAFKREMQNGNRVLISKFLYYLVWFKVLTENQIDRYIFKNYDDIKVNSIIGFLKKEGYLTEIINNITTEKCYCLSRRGLQIFERKDSWNDLRKLGSLLKSEFEKPSLFTTDYDFRSKEDLIKKIAKLNDITLFIYEVELNKSEFTDSYRIFNKEISANKLPYAEIIVNNNVFNSKLNILVLEASVCSKLNNDELASILNNIDIVLCISEDNIDLADSIQVLEKRKLFYIDFPNESNEVSIMGMDGNFYDFKSILKVLETFTEDIVLDVITPDAIIQPSYESLDINNFDFINDLPKENIDTKTSDNESDSAKKTEKINDKDANNNTEVLIAVTSKPELNLESYKCDIFSVIKLLNEERLAEAIALAKTLSFIPNTNYKVFYNRLLYATNMSIDNHQYSSNTIGGLDNKEVEVVLDIPNNMLKILRLSTFAWALLVPDVPHDHLLYSYKDSILAEVENNIKYPAVKSVFEILFEVGNYSPIGFTNSVVSSFVHDKQNKIANEELQKQAKGMITFKTPTIKMIGVPEMYKGCFDSSSELGKCMNIISQSDLKSIDFVRDIFNLFDEGLDDTITSSNKKIEKYIDEHWYNLVIKKTSFRKPEKLQHEVRNLVFTNIKKRLDIISQWLVINDNTNDNVIKNNHQLENLKNRLISKLLSASAEIELVKEDQDDYIKAGLCVLKSSMEKMREYLQDYKSYNDKWDYIEFTKSHFISLDSDYKPILNKNTQSIKGFEPWCRMIAHVNSEKVEYKEALYLIDSADKIEWFNNYNTATCICQYLHEKDGLEVIDYSNAIKQAQNDSILEREKLESELELAYAYGRIEESDKEDILRAINDFSEDLIAIGDFANHRLFLNVLREHINSCSENRKDALLIKTDSLLNNLDNIDKSVIEAINKNLEEQNFTVAEEYINRLEQGDLSLINELNNESVMDTESDYHDRFIENYNFFFNLCRNNFQENVLVKWAEKGIEPKIRSFSQGQKNNSKQLLESWPKSRDSKSLMSDVKRLLGKFGFTISDIMADSSYKKCELLNVKIVPKLKNLEDYTHPIAKFGTQISDTVSVLCLFGRTYSSPNALKEIFIDETLKLSSCTFVLVDAAFSLNERRQLAELLKSEIHSINSFIIIDRALMLYLATLDSSKWLSSLLKCTMPYTYCQPYVQGAGVVADEMFFGRKAELHNIRDYNGACLVYGGRQLGKTALLKRACSLANNPSQKKHALYVDIKKCDSKEAILDISEKLKEQNIINKTCSNSEELCNVIENSLSSGEISELQIFIDEADDFFSDISTGDYEELKPIKKLRDAYPNRFKVVFAGLHKVAHNKNNSVIIHLGTPLCIKPFSTADARNLLARPLDYLGFRFQDDEGKKQLSLIMANTNYYPGLLHMFCYKLVESISENYKVYYGATENNPPFVISEEHLRKLIFTTDLNEGIKTFFKATLSLDDRYQLIANIIAYLSYQDISENTIHPLGFHIEEIKNCENLQLTGTMKDTEFEVLLSEMVDMGILWNKPGTKYYRLRRNSFLEMLGSKDDVENYILSATYGDIENERIL
ncbi:MAG: hypothetical protein SA378_05430 [Sedimentibacter sp.]|uniref:hypothetical protein n=1 Tax=Sedimentibacter sp. TaxID=1960295 RepID=UPI0029829DD0|nr:hypothetical protein [Sedimentibacter sp.]MDW5299563.1 hypothetical protein [Sedimentibacter sp.]